MKAAVERRRLRSAGAVAIVGSAFLVASSVGFVAVAATPEECAAAGAAFERFLDGSFEVERNFRMSVNGNLAKREIARLIYAAGELDTEVLEDEVLSKSMVFESEGKDFVLEAEFDCGRLRVTDEARYELISEDGLEVVEFRLDREAGAFVPLSWRLDTTERFLFKKVVIEGRVRYSDFSWRPTSWQSSPDDER